MSKDFLNFIRSITMAFLWISGIFYDVNNMGGTLKTIMLLNPITIVVNGFRNSLVYKQWFWETPLELRNYVIVTVIMMVLSVWVYKKLRREVPDVL